MRKTLLKVTLIAVLALSISFNAIKKHHPNMFSSLKNFYVEYPIINTLKKQNLRLLFGCDQESLLTYHFGLKTLFPTYSFPTEETLENKIRSHHAFAGILSQQEALDLYSLGTTPYFIFEEKRHDKSPHFYIAHKNGLRHFTVMDAPIRNGLNIAFLLNGTSGYYPTELSLIDCTLYNL